VIFDFQNKLKSVEYSFKERTKVKTKSVISGIFAFGLVSLAHSGVYTGTIMLIAPSKWWGGTIVKLNGATISTGCELGDALFLSSNGAMDNSILSTLLTAQSTAASVKITTTSSCSTVTRPATEINGFSPDNKSVSMIMQVELNN
jgi:hypothetical protein